MRLEKIKLSGFKSFVDSTTISFPGNMVGVVGPNGCGKSNVIDAVRWVMGESSAKHLRGDLMADVVFNGSTSRKPVGQAFVELTFDNSDGKLGGEYASYQQIALKRQINREGQSGYFLNGTRCRKKDITDLFLGTGLGSRSYAIIEQGTISRLIEAKPDELRVFLEEAAGISKYKERRRETQNRIRRTRDNLERVSDLCDELEKQCRHLKRQANTAERFKLLKTQERELKAQLLALRWRSLDLLDQAKIVTLNELEANAEKEVVGQQALEGKLDATRSLYEEQREAWTTLQADFYAHGSSISQAEQSLRNQQDQQSKDQVELSQLRNAIASSEQALKNDQLALAAAEQLKNKTEQSLAGLKNTEQSNEEALIAAEESMRLWQKKWDDFISQIAEPKRQIDVARSVTKQLQGQVKKTEQRINGLVTEQKKAEVMLENNDLADKENKLKAVIQLQQAENEKLQTYQEQTALLRKTIYQDNEQLAELRAKHSTVTGQLASIELLEKASQDKSDEEVASWLEKLGLTDKQRLADTLEVEAGWELAVETVLATALQAFEAKDLADVVAQLSECPKGNLTLFSKPALKASDQRAETAIAKVVKQDMAAMSLFNNVHIAETADDALRLLNNLAADQSVISRDGVWLRHDYLSIKQGAGSTGQVLSRVKEKKQAQVNLAGFEANIAVAEAALTKTTRLISETEQSLGQAQQNNAQLLTQVSTLTQALNNKQSQIQLAQQILQKTNDDLAAYRLEQKNDESSLVESDRILAQSLAKAEQLDGQRAELELQGEQKRQQLHVARATMQAMKNEYHRLQLKQESERSSCALIANNSKTIAQQLEQSVINVKALEASLETFADPIDAQKITLQALLEKKLYLESQLTQSRESVENYELTIRQIENQRHQAEQQVLAERDKLSTAKIEQQEVLVRKSTLTEQLQERGADLEQLLEGLASDADSESWQQQVAEITLKIERLGIINLTAIEEYDVQSERQRYLEDQQADLDGSLLMLEEAVAKIDKESRSRFKETFEKVNAGFEKRFPKLFGGGHAYLQLTAEDLLEAGVTVMARPPGKRNSTIHLLSGGEKALTAVALVFAIFDLNPAPFCMLDEVDAPLDEANVGRFSELVKEMSEQVQMILITHNKRTMEDMHQLIGVTMKEAGVSRVVAVDLNEAAEMVES